MDSGDPIDPQEAFAAYRSTHREQTLQEFLDSFEDGQTVDASTAAVALLVSEFIQVVPAATKFREIA